MATFSLRIGSPLPPAAARGAGREGQGREVGAQLGWRHFKCQAAHWTAADQTFPVTAARAWAKAMPWAENLPPASKRSLRVLGYNPQALAQPSGPALRGLLGPEQLNISCLVRKASSFLSGNPLSHPLPSKNESKSLVLFFFSLSSFSLDLRGCFCPSDSPSQVSFPTEEKVKNE